jgi:uncharacterized cupredoxin-like copper-binding protein
MEQSPIMTRTPNRSAMVLLTAIALLAAGPHQPIQAVAHEGHGAFSAGEPGNPKKPARTINILMLEDGSRMMFEPKRIEVRRGEQIRFVLDNDGLKNHEFVLATAGENRKHAELMRKFPDMEHDDPNARRVAPYNRDEILWRFTKSGEFEFACLIPGHYEAGMSGTIIVK